MANTKHLTDGGSADSTYAMVDDAAETWAIPEPGPDFNPDLVPILSVVMSRKQAEADPNVALVRGLPRNLHRFQALSPEDQARAIIPCCLYFPNDTLRVVQWLSLNSLGIDFLCHGLGTDRAQLIDRLTRENPSALASTSGADLHVRQSTRAKIWGRLRKRDNHKLLDFAGQATEDGKQTAARQTEMLALLEDAINVSLRWIDPSFSNIMSWGPLTPQQRVGTVRMQSEVRRLVSNNTFSATTGAIPDGSQAAWIETLQMSGFVVEEKHVDELVDRFAEHYTLPIGLVNGYKRIYRNMLDHARRAHAFVVENNGDGAAVFAAISGVPPAGKVECIESPLAIVLRCHTQDDYVRLASKLPEDMAMDDDMLNELHGGACAGNWELKDGRTFNFIMENVPNVPSEYSQGLFVHEEEHSYLKYFDVIAVHTPVEGPPPSREAAATNLEWLEQSLRYYCQVYAERTSKEEILCYTLQGRSADDIQRTLDGGLYAFPAKMLKWIDPTGTVFTGRLGNIFRLQVSDHLHRAQRAGLRCMQRLLDAGWPRTDACELLATEPLEGWSALTEKTIGLGPPPPDNYFPPIDKDDIFTGGPYTAA